MNLKRPRCDYCGKKIYPKSKPFRRNSFLFGEIPSYCPDCGKEITNAKKAQLDEHDTFIYFLWCVIFISFVAIILITVSIVQNA